MRLEQIIEWRQGLPKAATPEPDLLEAFQRFTPHCRFIKTASRNGCVLDIGAGDGGLINLLKWPSPGRPDLHLFAYADQEGEAFHRFEGYEIGRWPDQIPEFSGVPLSEIIARNFIEHIPNPYDFVRWAVSRLVQGGRLYLEWPAPVSLNLPTSAELRKAGIDVMTGNYFDDRTHKQENPSTEKVRLALEESGASVEVAGVVSVPFFHDDLMAVGCATNNIVHTTLAYWSFTGWCQYIVAVRKKGA